MTHTIESVDHWPEGDTRVFPFIVPDRDADSEDARLNLSGADITWRLQNASTGEDVLDLSSDGVVLNIVSDINGEFEIRVEKEASEGIEGRFREIIRIVDDEGNRSTWKGRVNISKVT